MTDRVCMCTPNYPSTLKKLLWSTQVLCPFSFLPRSSGSTFVALSNIFLWHPGFYFRRFDSGWVRICKKTVLYNVEYMLRALTLENTLCRWQYIQWIFYMCSICKVIPSSINEWCLINNNLDFFFKNLKRLCCVFTIHFLFICCFWIGMCQYLDPRFQVCQVLGQASHAVIKSIHSCIPEPFLHFRADHQQECRPSPFLIAHV